MCTGNGEQQPAGLRPRLRGESPSPGLCSTHPGPLPCGSVYSSDLYRVSPEGREELTRKRPKFGLWGGNGVAVILPHEAEVTAITRPLKPETETAEACRLRERRGSVGKIF